MSANNSSSGSTRISAVPEAKEAMKRFKEEVASEIERCYFKGWFQTVT